MVLWPKASVPPPSWSITFLLLPTFSCQKSIIYPLGRLPSFAAARSGGQEWTSVGELRCGCKQNNASFNQSKFLFDETAQNSSCLTTCLLDELKLDVLTSDVIVALQRGLIWATHSNTASASCDCRPPSTINQPIRASPRGSPRQYCARSDHCTAPAGHQRKTLESKVSPALA